MDEEMRAIATYAKSSSSVHAKRCMFMRVDDHRIWKPQCFAGDGPKFLAAKGK
jgi:hypothetical protein